MGLGLAVQFVLRLVEVDFEAAGLRDVPGCVAEHLDAVAFRIVEINRPGIAVADWANALAAGRANLAEGALHIGEPADVERDCCTIGVSRSVLRPGTRTTWGWSLGLRLKKVMRPA